MAFVLSIIGSFLASFVNLMTKRNIDHVGSNQGYLVIYFLFSFIAVFLINPEILSIPFHQGMFTLGLVMGGMVFLMMFTLSQALKFGPPGLSFAFLNGSSVVPGILLFLVFGGEYGFGITSNIILGLLFVLGGLFWSAYSDYQRNQEKVFQFHKWFVFILMMFILQGTILSAFHWRSLLVDYQNVPHPLIFMQCTEADAIWFMPGFFGMATLLNSLVYFFKERRWFRPAELVYGGVGGLLNGVVTYLLLLAASCATVYEKGMIFPLFAVSVIALCSLWGKKLYQEKVNWLAIALCMLGILIATL